MFTGIIEEVGEVVQAESGYLRIKAGVVSEDTKLGDSIAINGVDLTVMDMQQQTMSFNVMPETYRRSNLSILEPGDFVNLERSVRPTDRLSGHIVRGVVEGIATVQSVVPEADAVIVTYETPPSLLRYVVVKGPICIDGASLTVTEKTPTTFSVSLVQYTQQHTVQCKPGNSVNIETDIVARYIEELLAARGT